MLFFSLERSGHLPPAVKSRAQYFEVVIQSHASETESGACVALFTDKTLFMPPSNFTYLNRLAALAEKEQATHNCLHLPSPSASKDNRHINCRCQSIEVTPPPRENLMKQKSCKDPFKLPIPAVEDQFNLRGLI